jgi:hypothetical protein
MTTGCYSPKGPFANLPKDLLSLRRSRKILAYLLLIPGLGLSYFVLMMVEQIGSPPLELETLRPFGSPTLSNLIEIPIAAAFGLAVAIIMLALRALGRMQDEKVVWRTVKTAYVAAAIFYFLMPTLPE